MTTPAPDLHSWVTELSTLYQHVWQLLVRGVKDRRAAARNPTLATVAPSGMPQARTVVLRAADQAGAMLEVHTDIRSAKISELRTNRFAALHIWDASAHLQTRLETEVTILSGADVEAMWLRVPDAARISYGGLPKTGAPIATSLSYTKTPDRDAFAVLQMRILAMDIVHLGPEHRRARFERGDGWAGQWLAP